MKKLILAVSAVLMCAQGAMACPYANALAKGRLTDPAPSVKEKVAASTPTVRKPSPGVGTDGVRSN